MELSDEWKRRPQDGFAPVPRVLLHSGRLSQDGHRSVFFVNQAAISGS